MKKAVIAALIGIIVLSGCSFLWNLTNAGTLKKDIRALLAHHTVALTKASCTMIGTTPVMVCKQIYRFAEIGLINVSRTEFRLTDQPGLEEIAGTR